MPPGRNDPCPCGSGRKYKHCCADADARQARNARLLAGSGAPAALAAPAGPARALGMRMPDVTAPPGAAWEVDAVPIAGFIDDTPDARMTAVLVGAGGLILHMDTLSHPPSEVADVAALLARVLGDAAAGHGRWPSELLVRHARVASALAPLVAARGVTVRHARGLPTLDAAGASLRASMSGLGADPGPVAAPATWAAWGLPRELLAELFSAAAAFHRARPWTHLYNAEALALTFPAPTTLGTGPWTACVLGNGGEQFGLSLYTDRDDFLFTLSGAPPGETFRDLQGAVIALDFSRRGELQRPMQREIAAAHWEVAGPEAYPQLWCVNTPAGGLPRADAEALVSALGAVTRFAAAHDALLATHPLPDAPITWTDAATGVVVAYEGDLLEEEESLWEPESRLAPGGASGPNADLTALLDPDGDVDAFAARGREVVGRYERALAETTLAEGTRTRHRMNAELFVDFLTGDSGVALAAVHEYDLRTFLYDWYPRKVRAGRTDAMALPASLRRFFRFLAEREGVTCAWADDILLDKDAYAERWDGFPGGFWWDEEVQDWRDELSRDLDARALLPSESLAGGEQWGATMQFEEARLHGELQRRWLAWRDEVIAAGTTEPSEARRALVERQRAWETRPHARLGGRTPVDVILRERRGRQ